MSGEGSAAAAAAAAPRPRLRLPLGGRAGGARGGGGPAALTYGRRGAGRTPGGPGGRGGAGARPGRARGGARGGLAAAVGAGGLRAAHAGVTGAPRRGASLRPRTWRSGSSGSLRAGRGGSRRGREEEKVAAAAPCEPGSGRRPRRRAGPFCRPKATGIFSRLRSTRASGGSCGQAGRAPPRDTACSTGPGAAPSGRTSQVGSRSSLFWKDMSGWVPEQLLPEGLLTLDPRGACSGRTSEVGSRSSSSWKDFPGVVFMVLKQQCTYSFKCKSMRKYKHIFINSHFWNYSLS